jgi:AcrR family transcriptional regulator
MPEPQPTRDRILDAFQDVLIEAGERAATIEAVAQRAGVSKGGLLYHFATKEAMIDALLARLAAQVHADIARMRTAPEGAVDYFIRSSVSLQSAFDRTILATGCLAQGAHDGAKTALQHAQSQWLATVSESVPDPDVASAIMLIGDGIYYNSSLGAGVPSAAELDALLRVIARLTRDEPAAPGRSD